MFSKKKIKDLCSTPFPTLKTSRLYKQRSVLGDSESIGL